MAQNQGNDPKNDRKSDEDNANTAEGPLSTPVSRRGFLTGAGVAGLAAATAPLGMSRTANAASPDGTPEQIHLTWGEDPTAAVVVSWASGAQAVNPRVHLGGDPKFRADDSRSSAHVH